MNIFLYIFRALYRIKWWLLIVPALFAVIAIYKTRDMDRQFQTDMTIYTGIISTNGSNPGDAGTSDWNMLNNSLQNIINTINSKETLKRLSLLLYARCMIHGNAQSDNVYISAKHYQELLAITPKAVRALIDKQSEENTVKNLERYEKADRNNFVYGLFNWNHPYFSYNNLSQNIKIRRVDNSDILNISYQTNDPGVAFQTLDILGIIYADEYSLLQYGKTNNVVKYFEEELARIGKELRGQEDSLTNYNVENRVINYERQTEAATTLDKEYELRHQDALLAYSSAQAAIQQLEIGMDANTKAIRSNSEFLSRLQQVAELNYSIAKLNTVNTDSTNANQDKNLVSLNNNLDRKEKGLHDFMDQYSAQKYTRDGYPNANYVTQWVDELLKLKKAEADLKVLNEFKADVDHWYTHYSPIGSVLKRKERSINFTEQNYLSILGSLNAARLRLKSIEMNSATLKVINPPTYPLNSLPNNRRTIVAGVYFGMIAFILGIFFILEFFDRTLKDRVRTERMTKGKVIAAFPKRSRSKNQSAIEQRAVQVLANQLYGFYNPEHRTNYVNVLKLSSTLDPTKLTTLLIQYWSEIGLHVRGYLEGRDFQAESRSYLIDQKWLEDVHDSDVTVIQHASMTKAPIPTAFLEKAMINLVVLRADTVWKTEDELLFNDLVTRSSSTPVVICLVNAERYVVEEFTGMLPPFTFLRRLEYQLANFGLTALGK